MLALIFLRRINNQSEDVTITNRDDIRKTTYRIGAFRVEPTRNLLKKDGQSYPLEPRIMDVLCELASYPGEVISRFHLIQRIWKVDFGADESLTRAISILRKTFRKDGATEKYIETISKNGYRLIAPVSDWIEDGTRNVPQHRVNEPAPQTPTMQPVRPTQPTSRPAVQAPQIQSAPSVIPTPQVPLLAKQKTKILQAAIGVVCGLAVLGFVIFGAATPEGTSTDSDFPDSDLTDTLDTIAIAEADRLGPSSETGRIVAPISAYGRSVAVLSFADMSLASDQEYFSDGMAEELLTQLSDIPGLRIVGRQASFSYKDTQQDFRTMGRDLQVSHIIDGAVRTQGELVRISAQLINTQNQEQIWSGSYDGVLSDGFALQDRISRDIVAELTLVLDTELEAPIPIDLGGILETDKTYIGEDEVSLIPIDDGDAQ